MHFRPHKALLQYECRAPPPLDGSGDGKNKRMFLGGFASAVEAAVCFAKHMESQGALVRARVSGRGRGRGSIRGRARGRARVRVRSASPSTWRAKAPQMSSP